jgi:NAD(P)H-dependent FMN reductase
MSNEGRLNIAVIVGSVRSGRFGDTVGRWITEQAQRREDVDVHVIDLAEPKVAAELALDFASGTAPEGGPSFRGRLADADAFIVVTCEYNHGYPASLKLAIDCAKEEWYAKPVGFVSYGGMAGGQRAVEQLRQVFPELHAVTIRETVSFHQYWENFGSDGRPSDAEAAGKAADVMLDQLFWWGQSLKEARAKRPYAG